MTGVIVSHPGDADNLSAVATLPAPSGEWLTTEEACTFLRLREWLAVECLGQPAAGGLLHRQWIEELRQELTRHYPAYAHLQRGNVPIWTTHTLTLTAENARPDYGMPAGTRLAWMRMEEGIDPGGYAVVLEPGSGLQVHCLPTGKVSPVLGELLGAVTGILPPATPAA
jgi:hypothetical protein